MTAVGDPLRLRNLATNKQANGGHFLPVTASDYAVAFRVSFTTSGSQSLARLIARSNLGQRSQARLQSGAAGRLEMQPVTIVNSELPVASWTASGAIPA